MTTSATGNPTTRFRAGFTLVELLSVVAIMAIVMTILGYAVSNMGGSATQVAASQVASGLSLARQLAVSKNTETRFVIANLDGATGAGLPQESFRHWTVVVSNRASGSWSMAKEWEKLPVGVVFLNIATWDYSVIKGDPITGATPGTPLPTPVFQTNGFDSGSEWRGFSSFTNLTVNAGTNGATFTIPRAPCIGFRGVGEAIYGNGRAIGGPGNVNKQEVAVRVAAGAVTPDHRIILRGTNDFCYIESDKRGRVRVRSPESYRP